MRRLASAGLTLIITGLAAIAIAMVAVPAVTGSQAFTIDRNSMQRVIPFGSLEYAHPEAAYGVGDVVVYRHNGNTITHAIVEVLPNPATAALDGTWFRTQGSENALPDDYEVAFDSIVGKVIWHAPLLGLATKVIGTLPVQMFLILTAAGLWWVSTSKKPEQAAVAA